MATYSEPDNIRKLGHLLKLKTGKKKLFVLREDVNSGTAYLEYYDSEKKYRAGHRPKRSIMVSDCFSINPKTDAKYKHAIALFTKDDCFTVVCDSEEEQQCWLQAMLELRNSNSQNGSPKPLFEHIWPVTVKPKGLGNGRHFSPGPYRLCLTNQSLGFVRLNHEEPDIIFQLACIRRCGHRESFFFLELGRQSVTGAGELWLQVEDTVIAQNMHEAILSSMKTINSSGEKQPFRPRSHSSTDKVTKPITIHSRTTKKRDSGFETSTLPVRSKTISAADNLSRSPLRRRHSQSPNKALSSQSTLRPTSVLGVTGAGYTLASSPLCENENLGGGLMIPDAHRLRTDSMESRGSSRGTPSSVSADEDLGELHANSSMGLAISNATSNYLDMAPMAKVTQQMAGVSDYMRMGSDMTRSSSARLEYVDMTQSASQDPYLEMAPALQHLSEEVYVESSEKPVCAQPSLPEESRPTDDSSYIDMSPAASALSSAQGSVSENDGGYIDMCLGSGSPSLHHNTVKPQRVISYLRDDDQSSVGSEDFPKRAGSVGSKVSALAGTAYLDMTGGQLSNKKSSSTPHLHDDPLTMTTPHSIAPLPEGADLFMEITFGNHAQLSSESLEQRPRTSSHGSSKDFRSRTSSAGSQSDFRSQTSSFGAEERRRVASVGTRDKISRLASFVRRNQKVRTETSAENHRPRTATICQDTLRPRTSSFGAGDMRPRSSSHGNARLRELKSPYEQSQHSSQEFLKRPSQDSINSASSDYLDMHPRPSSSPSQALVSGLKRSMEIDPDYITMDMAGKDSSDSGYVPMSLPSEKRGSSSNVKSDIRRPRSKSSSLEKKISNSSSDSLSSSSSVDHKSNKKHLKNSQSDYLMVDVLAAKDSGHETASESYMTFSPGSREPSPVQPLGSGLDKVTSPIRSDGQAAHDNTGRLPVGRAQDKSKKKGHEYLNLDYSGEKTVREPLLEGGNGGSSVASRGATRPNPKPAIKVQSAALPPVPPSPPANQPSKPPPSPPTSATNKTTAATPKLNLPDLPSLPAPLPPPAIKAPTAPVPATPQVSVSTQQTPPTTTASIPADPFQLNAKASGHSSESRGARVMPSRGSCGSLTGLESDLHTSSLLAHSKSNQFLSTHDSAPVTPSSSKLSLDTSTDGITYATLELTSSREDVGSTGNVNDRARHGSDEQPCLTPLSYAEIDFENCDVITGSTKPH